MMSDCGRAIIAAQPSVLQSTSAPLMCPEGRSDWPQLGLMNRRSHSARASPDRLEQVVRAMTMQPEALQSAPQAVTAPQVLQCL